VIDTGGRWVEFEIPWHETRVRNCPVCGKLVTRRAWQFATAEGALRVCDPDCEQLYESYFRPKHGPLLPGALAGGGEG
jgi:hypothetical protein